MPNISIQLSEDDHHCLLEEYKKIVLTWPHSKPGTVFPTFEEWLSTRLVNNNNSNDNGRGNLPPSSLQDLRLFDAIEKLITSLQPHGFCLGHLGQNELQAAEAAAALANTLVKHLGLAAAQAKRIQDLIDYYQKSAKEIADLAHIVVTNRGYGALHEAYRELVERTEKALDHLDGERAIGRTEGAVAVLVSMHVMTRETAKQKTDAFKAVVRNAKIK